MKNEIINYLTNFKQINILSNNYEYMIKISKKEKIFFGKNKLKAEIKTQSEHNRKKNNLIQEGTPIAPLVDMGIFTKDGKAPLFGS